MGLDGYRRNKLTRNPPEHKAEILTQTNSQFCRKHLASHQSLPLFRGVVSVGNKTILPRKYHPKSELHERRIQLLILVLSPRLLHHCRDDNPAFNHTQISGNHNLRLVRSRKDLGQQIMSEVY